MRHKPPFPEVLPSHLLLFGIGTIFALWLTWLGIPEKSGASSTLNESAGAIRTFSPAIEENSAMLTVPIEKSEHDDLLFFDRSPTDRNALISKTRPEARRSKFDLFAKGDLWLQDASGHERFVAREVVSAKFSPKGNKFAYWTQDGELFVETLEGQRLAQIPRAIDPHWNSDSVISFSAVPSLDHPDLVQPAVYDLRSGGVIQAAPEQE